MISDPKVDACLEEARQGFSEDIEPTLTEDGTSGAYIIRNHDGAVAVFKPIDEEPFAPNNPRARKVSLEATLAAQALSLANLLCEKLLPI